MRRRSLLVSLGTLTTGCVSIGSSNGPTRSGSGESPRSPHEEYRITRFSVTTSSDEYVLRTAARYSVEGLAEKRAESDEPVVVVDVSEIDEPDARDAIETAIREDEWGSDGLPGGLADLLERVDLFTGVSGDLDYTHFGLRLFVSPEPIEFDATAIDERVSPESPGTLEFSLANTGDKTQEVSSGTIVPFGLLRAERTADETEFLLWRDYEEARCVEFTDVGILRCLVGIVTPVEPGDVISRRYEVLPPTTTRYPDRTAPPGPGTYRITDAIEYGVENGGIGSTLSYEVAFTLEPP
jgi:hypothetical protein